MEENKVTEPKKNRVQIAQNQEIRYPYAKFEMPRITSEGQTMYREDAEAIIRLDGSYGTFHHFTTYCAKPGWKLVEVKNLDMENPEHRMIQADSDNRIAGRTNVEAERTALSQRVAELEAELKKKNGGEKQLPHELDIKVNPDQAPATEEEMKQQLLGQTAVKVGDKVVKDVKSGK